VQQRVAVCCSVLQCVAVRCGCILLVSVLIKFVCCNALQCVVQCAAVCCSMLQCVAAVFSLYLCEELQPAVCCNVLQCVAMRCNVLQCVATCCNVLQCVAVCCSNALWLSLACICAKRYSLLCVAAWRSVLQCVGVYYSVLQCVAAAFGLCLRQDVQPIVFVVLFLQSQISMHYLFLYVSFLRLFCHVPLIRETFDAMRCNALQRVAMCCSALQCVAVCCSLLSVDKRHIKLRLEIGIQ